VDHGSGYIQVRNQVVYSAVETFRSKQSYEQFALRHGVIVPNYLTGSGAFKANKFVKIINETQQRLHFCGTNAHHQNGVAERVIQTVSNLARAMILHASIHFKDGVDASLWLMAVQYVVHVYNNTHGDNAICPADIFIVGTVPRHCLRDIHFWGSPVYVLDPKLQQGKKLPRWQPRSRRGMFLGLIQEHSSEVPQVLNFSTGWITTQYHVVFDDLFTTVPSIYREHEPPSHWDELCMDEAVHIPVENEPEFLQDDWLTPGEIERKNRIEQREDIIRDAQASQFGIQNQPVDASVITSNPSVPVESVPANVLAPPIIPTPPAPTPSLPVQSTTTTIKSEGAIEDNSGLRRSTHSTARQRLGKLYHEEAFLAKLCSDDAPSCESSSGNLAYLDELHTDMNDGTIDIIDPRVCAVQKRMSHDPDTPMLHEAMRGPRADEYKHAMKIEIAGLIKQRTCKAIELSPSHNFIKST
jgi:hypothetical protein